MDKTTQEAVRELNEACSTLRKQIEAEIHIVELIERLVKLLEKETKK